MSTWTVSSYDEFFKVSLEGEQVVANDAAEAYLRSQNVGVFDHVYFPPLVEYRSEGLGDTTAAYLNALLYLPNPVVTGAPPIELNGDDAFVTPLDDEGEDMGTKALPASYRRARKPDDDFHTGGMVALVPDAESAAKLHVPGGDAIEELHLTLFYMADAIMATESQRDILRAFIQYTIGNYGWHDRIQAMVSGAGVLGEENAKVYLVGDSFEMKMFYEQIQRMFDQITPGIFPVWNSQREPWIAHLTAGYGDSVDVSKLTYRGPIVFDRVRVSIGETITDFDIRGSNQLAEDTLEYLSQHELVDIDTTVPETDTPTLKSLAQGPDLPGDLALKALGLSNEEIAKDFVDSMNGESKKRGNAETLRRYWTTGEGAGKIVWGRPGDFKSCVRKVRKYMRDPEGYCANLHHRATGEWPGPKAHGGKSIPVAPDSIMDHIARLALGYEPKQDNLSETTETKES